ncbi:MAG: radical SAM protein [Candidatus Hydrogenedentota bacterium]
MFEKCRLCGFECGVNRIRGEKGRCKAGCELKIAKWLLHFGEEPPISGNNGSGTIFFSCCSLQCVFCQNYQISQERMGELYSIEEFVNIIFSLQNKGCHNINLVSPTHFTPLIKQGIIKAKNNGLKIPVVYNTNGFDSRENINMLEGIVDIYLPDFKYFNDGFALKYSYAKNYRKTAEKSILEMYRQVGHLQLDPDKIAYKGILIRHLVLPDYISGTFEILKWIKDKLSKKTYISIMSQYNPVYKAKKYPEINRTITRDEYEKVIEFAAHLGFSNCFIQDYDSPDYYLPDFSKENPFNWTTRVQKN